MSGHGAHSWWYRCLTNAGIVPEGTTSGERMHKARHTAGQRVLDATGNLKAVQKLLGHSSIQTTGDIYADWDIDQLAATMAEVLADESESFPRLLPESPCLQGFWGNSGDGGNRTHVRDRVKSGFYERIRRSDLTLRSPRRRGCGDQPPGISPHWRRRTARVSLLSDPGFPRHRRAGAETSRLSY